MFDQTTRRRAEWCDFIELPSGIRVLTAIIADPLGDGWRITVKILGEDWEWRPAPPKEKDRLSRRADQLSTEVLRADVADGLIPGTSVALATKPPAKSARRCPGRDNGQQAWVQRETGRRCGGPAAIVARTAAVNRTWSPPRPRNHLKSTHSPPVRAMVPESSEPTSHPTKDRAGKSEEGDPAGCKAVVGGIG